MSNPGSDGTDPYVLHPSGTISATNASEFRQQLSDAVESGHVHLRIDLDAVDMIDSTGLSVFVQCYQSVIGQGGSLTVVTDNNDLRGLFHLMGLDQHFTVRGKEAA